MKRSFNASATGSSCSDLRDAQNNDDILECMLDRTLHGGSSHDFQVKGITAEDIKAAARRFLPAHKGA